MIQRNDRKKKGSKVNGKYEAGAGLPFQPSFRVLSEEPRHKAGIEPKSHVLNLVYPLIETQIERKDNVTQNE